MYTPPKQPEQGKIRLPRAAAAPSIEVLTDMFTQACDNKPREVELVWNDAALGKIFSIGTKFEMGAHDPTWTLWEDNGQESSLAWRFESSDFQLLSDMLSMLTPAKQAAPAQVAVQQPQSPFAQPAQPAQPSSPVQQSPFAQPAPQPAPVAQPAPPAQPAQAAVQQPYSQFSREAASAQHDLAVAPQDLQGYQGAGGSGVGQDAGQGSAQTSGTQPPQGYQGESPYASPSASPPQPGQQGSSGFQPAAAPASLNQPGGAESQAPAQSEYASLAPREVPEGPYAKPVRAPGSVEGTLKEMPVPVLLQSVSNNRRSGKLEILGEESVGEIFFEHGEPVHAGTPNAYGDAAIKEVVTWERGTFLFTPDLHTPMRSIKQPLSTSIEEGKIRADQKRHLKRAGLTYESYLVRRHKDLSESELKLMLTKGESLDWELQREIYDYLRHKRTFTDLLRDKPMDSEKSTVLLYNFLSCGLIDIKEGDSFKGTVLDFMGEAKGQVDAIQESFTRPETGIYHYQALMFFARYEYFRFEAYNYPLSLIVFQMQNKRDDGSGGADLLNTQASNAASMRIDLIKRPLDVLGHFETIDYALLLPNTRASSASFIANRVYEALTATPLTKGVDKSTLMLAFGIANLPNDGDDLESLILAAKAAKEQAQRGSFPIVLSRSGKKR